MFLKKVASLKNIVITVDTLISGGTVTNLDSRHDPEVPHRRVLEKVKYPRKTKGFQTSFQTFFLPVDLRMVL
jgi:hypothetical protein